MLKCFRKFLIKVCNRSLILKTEANGIHVKVKFCAYNLFLWLTFKAEVINKHLIKLIHVTQLKMAGDRTKRNILFSKSIKSIYIRFCSMKINGCLCDFYVLLKGCQDERENKRRVTSWLLFPKIEKPWHWNCLKFEGNCKTWQWEREHSCNLKG